MIRRGLFLARFFFVLRVVPPGIVTAFAFVTGIGSAALVVDAESGVRTVVPVLLLQLFAAASGFCIPARRGHYDLLLTSGETRLSIAVMHWATSALPGAASWFALATVERVYGGNSLVAPSTLVAMLIVSTVPWSLTVPFPRLTGGIAWLLILALAAIVRPREGEPAAAFLPWALLGRPLDPVPAAVFLVLAGVLMIGAFAWITRMDVPLESGQ